MKLPKLSPQQMIHELRFTARIDHEDMDEDLVPLEEMTTWEAADLIQKYHGALQKIADGEPKPQAIATEALKQPEAPKRSRELPFRAKPD